jgi:hypothetical protein
MAGELMCPECGGVVGATETTEAGQPCSCFTNSSDTAVDMPSPAGVSAPSKPKICVVCGKDVAGHRRLKDSRGYVCYSCAKEEQRQERGGRVRCRSCGRLVKEETLNDYEGTRMCNRCYSERIKLQKQEIKRAGIVHVQTKHERTTLYRLLIVACILLIIAILNHFNLLPHMF